MQLLRRTALFIVAMLGLIFVIFESHKLVTTFTPPLMYLDAKMMTPEVKSGEKLITVYTFIRRRICRTHLDRFIYDTKSNNVVWRNSVVGAVAQTGEFTVRNDVEVPKFPIGEYELSIFTFSECLEGLHSINAPKLKFTVVK